MTPTAPGLVFDEEKHVYYLNGHRIPGVTSILEDLVYIEYAGREFFYSPITGQCIDAETIRKAGDYGRATHKVMELALVHGIDAITYPQEIDPAVKALAQWQKDWQPEIVAVEFRGASARLGYAGTLDIMAYIPRFKCLCLTDVKTGPGPLTGPQTAAYEKFYREMTGERKKIMRHKLRLPKTPGKPYRFDHLDNPADWSYFQSRLFMRQFHQTL